MERLREVMSTYRPETGPPGLAAATSSSGDGAEAAAEAAACAACTGIGWVRRDVAPEHPDFGRLFPCGCQRQRFDAARFSRLTRYSNLGGLAPVTFDALQRQQAAGNPLLEQAIATARDYASAPDGWLVLTGPPGSGKTRLAAAIANECIRQGRPVLFIPVADLLDHLRSTMSDTSEVPYTVLLEQVRNVPVLVLDDLGNENPTGWAQEKLDQILGHRYNARTPTVVTTGLPLARLPERLQARLADPTVSTVLALGQGQSRQADPALERLDLRLPHMDFASFEPQGGGLQGPIRDNLTEACRLARSYAEHPDGWLVLIGKAGCGKSHLASAIANAARQHRQDVLFLLVPEFLDYLRSTFNQEGNPGYQAFEQVQRAGLLILDDFSETLATPWTREKLDLLLNHRYLNRLPTVITSSLSPEEMEPRIWSRISDGRLSTVYEIRAPDYRTGREYPQRAEREAGSHSPGAARRRLRKG